MFFANSVLFRRPEKSLFNTTANNAQLPHVVTGNIIELYWSESSKHLCKADFFSNNTNITTPSNEEIVEYSLIYYLTALVSKNNLDSQKIFFLDRIADFVNRGTQFFGYSTEAEEFEKHAEYIVRLPEFIVAGLNDEILSSMSKAKEFWQQHISPNVQQAIDTYYQEHADQINFCNQYIITDTICYLNQTQPEVLGEQPDSCFNL